MTTREHDLSELIPDYVSDRMDADERAEFERLIEEDSTLLDEVNDFKEFQSLYREVDSHEPAPSNALFDRICVEAGIEQKVAVEQQIAEKVKVRTQSLANTLQQYWDTVREYFTVVPWALAAVQMAVIVLLLMPATEQKTYQTLSATQGVENSEVMRINVVFQPKATESQIRELLNSVKGSVTSGPSKEGRYIISIDKESDLNKAVELLQEAQIVLFAEPVS